MPPDLGPLPFWIHKRKSSRHWTSYRKRNYTLPCALKWSSFFIPRKESSCQRSPFRKWKARACPIFERFKIDLSDLKGDEWKINGECWMTPDLSLQISAFAPELPELAQVLISKKNVSAHLKWGVSAYSRAQPPDLKFFPRELSGLAQVFISKKNVSHWIEMSCFSLFESSASRSQFWPSWAPRTVPGLDFTEKPLPLNSNQLSQLTPSWNWNSNRF